MSSDFYGNVVNKGVKASSGFVYQSDIFRRECGSEGFLRRRVCENVLKLILFTRLAYHITLSIGNGLRTLTPSSRLCMRRRNVVLALFAEVVFALRVFLVVLCETAACCCGGSPNGCVLRKTLGGLE